jgi:hypothetical protein
MHMPSLNAEVSLYRSTGRYVLSGGWAAASDGQLGLSQFGSPEILRTPIVCNGNCPPPICHFHCGPCSKDPTVPTGCSRQCCSFGPGCDDSGCSTVDCPSGSCCPTTCGACTGGQCNAYPNCGPIPGSGTQTCTDCHGTQTSRPC